MNTGRIALIVAVVAAATVAGAWAFQAAGYAPCELCLKERIFYYVGAPLALLAAVLAMRRAASSARVVLAIVAIVFAAGTVLGVYHSGVEFGWWPGPADCTGNYTAAASTDDFLKQLQTTQVIRCDAVAVRVIGLSLAVWNALISAGLGACAMLGVAQAFDRSKPELVHNGFTADPLQSAASARRRVRPSGSNGV